MVIVGRERGASNAETARHAGLDTSVVSRRYQSEKLAMKESSEAPRLVKRLQDDFGELGMKSNELQFTRLTQYWDC